MNKHNWMQAVLQENSHVSRWISNAFHLLYYHASNTWQKNTFLGYPIGQCPFDMQVYQELIFQTRPSFISQTGVAQGGSILYFASLLDLMGAEADIPVIGIDIRLSDKALNINHPRVKLIEGDSTEPSVVDRVKSILRGRKGMVSLDSDHHKEHVLAEMKIYKSCVAIGSYLVVEDTNLNGHPVKPSFGPGPYEAVEEFIQAEQNFLLDDVWKRNRISFHQHGWLKRIG